MSEIADSPPASGIDISAAPKQGSRVAKNWVVYFSFLLIGWVVTFLTEKLVQTRLGEKAVGQLATSTSVVVACASVFGFGRATPVGGVST